MHVKKKQKVKQTLYPIINLGVPGNRKQTLILENVSRKVDLLICLTENEPAKWHSQILSMTNCSQAKVGCIFLKHALNYTYLLSNFFFHLYWGPQLCDLFDTFTGIPSVLPKDVVLWVRTTNDRRPMVGAPFWEGDKRKELRVHQHSGFYNINSR